MIAVISAAVSGDVTRRITLRGTGMRPSPSMTARTTRGCTSSPPLATALAAAAIWSGVTPTW